MEYQKHEEPDSSWRLSSESWSWFQHKWWNWVQRPVKFWWQRQTRGFDDSETWSLDYTICKFVLPRIRHLAATTHGYPTEFLYGEDFDEAVVKAFEQLSEEEQRSRSDQAFDKWRGTLGRMARAMEIWVEGECWYEPNTPEEQEWKEGMALFFKYFFALWD